MTPSPTPTTALKVGDRVLWMTGNPSMGYASWVGIVKKRNANRWLVVQMEGQNQPPVVVTFPAGRFTRLPESSHA